MILRDFIYSMVYLGVSRSDTSLEARTVKLCNQINLFVFMIMLVLLIILKVMSVVEGSLMGVGSLRVFLVLFLTAINLFLAWFKLLRLSKVFTIFLPVTIFLLFPTFIGFVEPESFVYYPFVAIAFSVVPQLLLLPDKNKWLYAISITYFSAIVVFIDSLLVLFMPKNFNIVNEISEFYIMYKLSHIGVFVFINFSVLYLRRINERYEGYLQDANIALNKKTGHLLQENIGLDSSNKKLELTNVKLTNAQKKISKDNIELSRALKDLKTAQQKLIHSEKMAALGTLTAGVAHEINNPLNFIGGGASMLDIELEGLLKIPKGGLSEEKVIETVKVLQESSQIINAGIKKVSKIVEALNIYSFSGESPIEIADIHDIIESTLMFLKRKIKENIRFEKRYSLKQKVPVQKNKMHQVFLNILDNAIYAVNNSQKPKIIRITTEMVVVKGNTYAKISIVNSGDHMTENELKRAFEPFYTTKKPGEGTGLGLSITYNLVEAHKGELKLKNVERGVECILTLPC